MGKAMGTGMGLCNGLIKLLEVMGAILNYLKILKNYKRVLCFFS
jgi:hypothetical protein